MPRNKIGMPMFGPRNCSNLPRYDWIRWVHDIHFFVFWVHLWDRESILGSFCVCKYHNNEDNLICNYFTNFFWTGRIGCQTCWEFPSRGMMCYALSEFKVALKDVYSDWKTFWEFPLRGMMHCAACMYTFFFKKCIVSYCSVPLSCPEHIHT